MTFVLRTSYDGWSAGTRIELQLGPSGEGDRVGPFTTVRPVRFPNGEEWAIDVNDIVELRNRTDSVPALNREARRKIKEALL